MTNDTSFARLVSLACHDLRTPLATVHGFAKTLTRGDGLSPPADRYVEMIVAAAAQIAELLDELSLAARIESGRYEPGLREADTLELARNAAARLGEERVARLRRRRGVETDPDARRPRCLRPCSSRRSATAGSTRSPSRSTAASCASRRSRTPPPRSCSVDDLRDLGAAVAVLLVGRLGGSVAVTDGTLSIRVA